MDTRASQNTHRQAELQRVALQAAEWLVALDDSAAKDHEALAEWLLESPLHTRMFLRAAAIDRQAASLHPTILNALMEQAAREPTNNILPLLTESLTPIPSIEIKARRKRWPLAAGLTALAASVGCVLWWHQSAGPGSWQHYLTNVGEQRSVSLQDGSLIYLNTRSSVDVRFSGAARDIRLLNGEALFTVQKDASRPFRVHVDEAAVQAIGTQFNVYRREKAATVTVIEGLVRISREPEQAPQQLAAGETAIVSSAGQIEKRDVGDIAQAVAWRQRQLVFERASLEDIATEFNRYNRTPQLKIDERLAGRHRYTAVFDADNPQLLLQFLARDPLLRLNERGDELVVEPR